MNAQLIRPAVTVATHCDCCGRTIKTRTCFAKRGVKPETPKGQDQWLITCHRCQRWMPYGPGSTRVLTTGALDLQKRGR